jgi:glycosyltransferase involved in cell wall biosynthesis
MMAAWLTKTPQICHFRHFSDKLPLIRKRMAVRVDAALYTTQAIADSYLEKGIPIANWDIVYEPIDVHRFSESRDSNYLRQQLSIGDDEYLISNIGRITSWKGQYYFLQAVEEIIAQFPNTKALIVGEPGDNTEDKAYFTSLQEMSKKASIRDHIIFTGNRDDIAAIMAASDIVVHSACKPEPFGLVIAEAMATGTPVIATRGGGTTEIIQDGVNGLLVPMSSSSHIKYAIQRLLESENLRASLSAAALEEVTERFTIEQHVSKVQACYERICAAR